MCIEDRRSTREMAGRPAPKLASVSLPALTSRSSLLLAGSIAAPAFVASFLVQQSRRLDYNPRRHPVSSLALGPQGGQQERDLLHHRNAPPARCREVGPHCEPGPQVPDGPGDLGGGRSRTLGVRPFHDRPSQRISTRHTPKLRIHQHPAAPHTAWQPSPSSSAFPSPPQSVPPKRSSAGNWAGPPTALCQQPSRSSPWCAPTVASIPTHRVGRQRRRLAARRHCGRAGMGEQSLPTDAAALITGSTQFARTYESPSVSGRCEPWEGWSHTWRYARLGCRCMRKGSSMSTPCCLKRKVSATVYRHSSRTPRLLSSGA